MLLQLSQFFFLCPLHPLPSFPPAITSNPLVHVHEFYVCSLASPFLTLFLTPPCLFCSYQLSFLIHTSLPPLSSFPLPADNSGNDAHNYDAVRFLVVCLVYFCFYFLDSLVDSCEFVVILMFIVLIFFFLNKSL